MAYKNHEGYTDNTQGIAIRRADREPKEITDFRRIMKHVGNVLGVRILGKVTLIDKRGRRW